MKVAFHTLGCKVNHYETEAMKEAFVSRGAEITDEDGFADVYVINSCTVTNIADRKSRQFMRRARRNNPDAVVVVTGCYAQVAAEEIAAMPEVDLIVGNGRKSEICGLVTELLEKKRAGQSSSDAPGRLAEGDPKVLVYPREELTFYEDMGSVDEGSEGMSRAYIKIQDGCDRFCSYCLIPYARGPVRSRPADEIIEEAAKLVGKGYREIVLTGINTALYGTEAGAECSLSELLTRLDELETAGGDFRVRLSSLEPTVVDKDNVEEIIRHRRLCHHLHLSVQNGSDSVLKSMNRRYTRGEYLDIVKAIREYDPLFGITTDIIAGFPGETESDLGDTLDIVRQAGFGRTHVFRYSPRRGTAGAKLPDAVPESVKKERAAAIERLGEETAAAFIEANLGVPHTVLVEERTGGFASGYTGNYIKVYIRDEEGDIPLNGFCEVTLTGAYLDGASAERI